MSTRVLEMTISYMFVSLVPVGSRYLHCLRKAALHLLIKLGWLVSQCSRLALTHSEHRAFVLKWSPALCQKGRLVL